MSEIPQRSSLVVQTAEILRRGIERGEWGQHLPGERILCEQFKVSRYTVRAALAALEREGLIEVSTGQPRSVSRRREPTGSPPKSNVVGVLTGIPYHELSSFSLFLISELQEELHREGYELQVHASPRFGSPYPARSLEKLLSRTRVSCWILLGPPRATLMWFAKRKVRAIVQGALHESNDLPSFDVDVRAAARHAVGMFRRKGHRRIALVIETRDSDLSNPVVKGYREGLAAVANRGDGESRLILHPGTIQGIQAAVDAALAARDRPTALLIARPRYVLTVVTHVTNSGFHIPKDLSFISLGHLPYLDDMTPSIAHYTFDWREFAQRFSARVRVLAEGGGLPHSQVRLIPRFRDGATLGPRPA